ncbi:hypothetical protein [Pseudoalteromonas sp. R3]|uniref:hypothetical protein n=1 Tax=Pseudoalteromonas sp. R3 TaxID=1709477 RepID=UPI0006B5D71D|nr:hypothetical protein [Pseudoalteromonas sp. R3]AZZ98025.1 hypothetical protein ELR70_13440 [Pseudoalteromonas sp. R3]
MTLTALKISHLEQLNSKIFALLSTLFSRLKIEHLIKQIGISYQTEPLQTTMTFWIRSAKHGMRLSHVLTG